MTTILNRSYGQIEGRSIPDLLRESFGPEFQIEESLPVQEAQVGTRYFRFNLSPVVRSGVEAGSIFIVSEITEQKRAQAAFVINERLAATGRMANTIAHEINNPLEAITNLLYLMNGALKTPEIASGFLGAAHEELSRVSRIARQILSFNREAAVPVAVRLFELLEDVLALNNRTIIAKTIEIEKDWDESIVVSGFPAQLRQVFSNLLRNAIEASNPGKKILLRISRSQRWSHSREPSARVSFADQGCGILPENMERIFEAFFTTKELKGSGIGLWLSSTIIQEHRGRIQVRSCTRPLRSGTCVSVVLPRQQ